MRRFLFPAALAVGLMFIPSTAQASWLSEALHRLRGDYAYPPSYGDYVSPGYYDYSYVSPGYSVDPGYDYGYVAPDYYGSYYSPGFYSYRSYPYRYGSYRPYGYSPRYYGWYGHHGYGYPWHGHHGHGDYWHHGGHYHHHHW